MVFKNIQKIKDLIPDILHLVMFYDDGTVFQTTFEPSVNIPKLGKELSNGLKEFSLLFEIPELSDVFYKKVVIETSKYIIIIIKLGEQSNLALFFINTERTPNISLIRRYIEKIEDFMDTDKFEIEKQYFKEKKEELKKLEEELENFLNANEKRRAKLFSLTDKIKELVQTCKNKEIKIEKYRVTKKEIEGSTEKVEELNILNEKLERNAKELELFKDVLKEKEIETENLKVKSDYKQEEKKRLEEKIQQLSKEISEVEEKIKIEETQRFEGDFLV